jgi:hypothetical protein
MALTAYEIPLSAQAQSFSVSLAGVTYNFTLVWRSYPEPGNWALDIADASSNPLIQGIPLVTGVDLLAQYAHVGIGGELWALTDGAPGAVPTYSNLGSLSHLYFVVND